MKNLKIKDYVSNDTQANEIITNFDNNKLVIKGDTGIGGTTSILNITDKTVIIISPLTGMIKGKENRRESHQMFIYKDSKDRWFHFEREINGKKNVILNTTPEQIIELRNSNPELYLKVLKIPFFVDEFQVYAESEYREKLNEFYNILFNDHSANKTLSTATPTYKNLDIPKHFLDEMEIIKIQRIEQREKYITIEPIENYYNFVKSNCDKGIKVVLFTNDIRKINNIINSENFPYKVQTLVGTSLGTKLSQYSPKTKDEDYLMEKAKLDLNADVYILSTKYLIGYDIEFDAAIGIIMDEISNVNNFNVNQFVQAYGRVRKNVVDASIFYHSTSTENIEFNQLEKEIANIKYDENYLKNIQPYLFQINNGLTYPISNLMKSLSEYGFTTIILDELTTTNNVSTTFPERYRNLINQEDNETYILSRELNYIMNNIQGDDKSFIGFNSKYLLLWASAYIAVETQSPYLLNFEAERYERLLLRLKTFIDVNELAFPDKMTEMDQITKFRVSKNMQDIAIRDGAICEIINVSTVVKNDSGKLELNRLVETTRFNEASNRFYDETFNKAKYIINSLYTIHLINRGEYSSETERIIHGFSTVSKCIIDDFVSTLTQELGINIEELIATNNIEELNKIPISIIHSLNASDVFSNTKRKILSNLKKLEGYELYSQNEINQIMDKASNIKTSLLECKNGIRNTIKMNTYSIEKQKERHKYYILYLLSHYLAGHAFGFLNTKKDNRIYNPLTKTTRQLRGYTPYQMLQSDIKSAFATFLDVMIGSNIALEVYGNIEMNREVDRNKAKRLYNSILNNYRVSSITARKFYRDCGYKEEHINQIIKLTTKERGGFYREMTRQEEKVIKEFKDVNELQADGLRLHDAVIFPNLPKYQNLQLKIGNCEFEVKLI
jgi:hypothetical protein